MKTLLVKLCLRLARYGGWVEPVCTRPHTCPLPHITPEIRFLRVDESLLRLAAKLVAQLETLAPAESGEYKRAQVLRALLNQNPGVSERECAKAIEVALELK